METNIFQLNSKYGKFQQEIDDLKKKVIEIDSIKIELKNKDREISKIKSRLNLIENSLKIIDEEFTCPISNDDIKNPIITPNGFLYEESEIIKWIKINQTDPICQELLSEDQLIESAQLKNALKEYISLFI